MKDKRIEVTGGGKNIYKISEYNGWYHVSHVSVGFISNTYSSIGKARSLQDAYDIIKSYSGREIKKIT